MERWFLSQQSHTGQDGEAMFVASCHVVPNGKWRQHMQAYGCDGQCGGDKQTSRGV